MLGIRRVVVVRRGAVRPDAVGEQLGEELRADADGVRRRAGTVLGEAGRALRPFGAAWLSRYEYQISGCLIGGPYSRPGSTLGPPFATQREEFCGPRVGSSQSCVSGAAALGSGVEVLKSQLVVRQVGLHTQRPAVVGGLAHDLDAARPGHAAEVCGVWESGE